MTFKLCLYVKYKCYRGENSNTDTLTINHHDFIISQLNISKCYK